MKILIRNLILISLILFAMDKVAYSQNSQRLLTIPFEMIEGYSEFMPGVAQLMETSFDESENWAVTDTAISGVPADWGKVIKKMIPFDMLQYVYQNYKAGKLTKDVFDTYARDYWNVDDRVLSHKAIKCYVYLIYTRGDDGSIRCMVDTNNDKDFRNEIVFKAPVLDFEKFNTYTKNAFRVKYERMINGKVVESDFPLVIVYDSKRDRLAYNIPVYGKADYLDDGGNRIHLQINAGFTSLSFEEPALAELSNGATESKIDFDQLIQQGQYLKLLDKTYQNLGVDINKMTLKLQEVDNVVFSSQEGYSALRIEGINLMNGHAINTDQYKERKYVLLDFWATWCSPCIRELPNLKRLKEKIDPTKFEIIGIVPDEDDELLKRTFEKYDVSWPQLKSNSRNNIIKNYSISAFPSTILIDKSGLIVAVGLRGAELERKIDELVKK